MNETKPEPAAGQVWEGPTGQRFEIRKVEHGRAYGVRDGVNFSVQRGVLLDGYELVAQT